ncbi:MAG: hypothetical protein HOP14_14450 [Acidobacteria bacterium]|nr:hypothetical protein [Acidobacteriota bacterium]
MTLNAQVAAVVAKGFTERQARFLVLVMRHAGVCVMRQYATFADIVFGDKTRAFFAKLERLGYASSFDTSKGRGRLFHVHGRELYEAIGKPHSRFRRPPPVAHAVERCMLLDVVLAHPDVVWLENANEKVVHLTTLAGIPLDDLPHSMVGIGARRQPQHFPDRLPVGIHPEGRVVLVYLPVSRNRDHVADFVQRHTAMLARLPAWTISLAEPHHPSDTVGGWVDTVREHLAAPLRPSDRTELRWYFERLKDGHRTKLTASDKGRLERCVAAFEGARFRALYRAWVEDGDRVLDVASEPAIAKALASGAGVVDRVTLSHGFRHLSFLVTSQQVARSRTRGAKLGDEVGQWLQPRSRCSHERQDVAAVDERPAVGSETRDDVTRSCPAEAR